MKQLNRNEFIKIGSSLLSTAFFLPNWQKKNYFSPPTLPKNISNIFSLIPTTIIDESGYLYLSNNNADSKKITPQFQTDWNKERNFPVNRLSNDMPWGIVLHRYGDSEYFDHSIKNFIHGFNTIRNIGNYVSNTSAHFLIGKDKSLVHQATNIENKKFGIIQTQFPDTDGTPFTASHIRIDAGWEEENYFANANYLLTNQYPNYTSLNTEIADNPNKDINEYTIAIEITGIEFEQTESEAENQQVANVLGCVIAIMKRYNIYIGNLAGHHEIDPRKSDPGKNYLSLIKFLIGAYAIETNDTRLAELVFSPFQNSKVDNEIENDDIVREFFDYIISYQYLLNTPISISAWEKETKYWLYTDYLFSKEFIPIKYLEFPIRRKFFLVGSFLDNDNLEGINLYSKQPEEFIQLIGSGKCIEIKSSPTYGNDKHMVIFKHRLEDGREYISIYDNLDSLSNIIKGNYYSQRVILGNIKSPSQNMYPFLHFTIGYGATWDILINKNFHLPTNFSKEWVLGHFLNPTKFVKGLSSPKLRMVEYNKI